MCVQIASSTLNDLTSPWTANFRPNVTYPIHFVQSDLEKLQEAERLLDEVLDSLKEDAELEETVKRIKKKAGKVAELLDD